MLGFMSNTSIPAEFSEAIADAELEVRRAQRYAKEVRRQARDEVERREHATLSQTVGS